MIVYSKNQVLAHRNHHTILSFTLFTWNRHRIIDHLQYLKRIHITFQIDNLPVSNFQKFFRLISHHVSVSCAEETWVFTVFNFVVWNALRVLCAAKIFAIIFVFGTASFLNVIKFWIYVWCMFWTLLTWFRFLVSILFCWSALIFSNRCTSNCLEFDVVILRRHVQKVLLQRLTVLLWGIHYFYIQILFLIGLPWFILSYFLINLMLEWAIWFHIWRRLSCVCLLRVFSLNAFLPGSILIVSLGIKV